MRIKLNLMDFLNALNLEGGMALGALFVALVALAGNWRLYVKCGQPGWSVVVPGYNVVVAMRIIGRPASHALRFLIPGYNIYFFFRTMVEVASTFGKRSTFDHVLACVFHVFYVLNLGLSEEEEYQGPVHGKLSRSDAHDPALSMA